MEGVSVVWGAQSALCTIILRGRQFWGAEVWTVLVYIAYLRCERSSALGLDSVWLQGAAVPGGSVAQTLRQHSLLILPFYFFSLNNKTLWNRAQWTQGRWADQLCLADWSVVDTVWWHWCLLDSLWGGWSQSSPTPCTIFLQPWFCCSQKEGEEAERTALHFGAGGKTPLLCIRPRPSRVVCGQCVLSISSREFPTSFPMELLSSAPAPSEPLWGGRCRVAVGSLANRPALKKKKRKKENWGNIN